MLTFPNAKINIGLSITEKREDGYHNIESIFYPVQIKDALEIIDTRDTETAISMSGLPVSGGLEQNLVWRAYQLLFQDFPEKLKPLSIYLHKIIPMGAGMGGGSADGSFMLSMLNKHFDLQLTEAKLIEYALQLGSDCPFFIINKPCFAKGRGELLEPLLSLDLSQYTIQVICPAIHVRTATAFTNIKPKASSFNLKNINSLKIAEWKNHISNDFEASVFNSHPALESIKTQLYEQGALYAAMSGTGSTVYGIFKKGEQAKIKSGVAFQEFFS